jgi:hypothetical protein
MSIKVPRYQHVGVAVQRHRCCHLISQLREVVVKRSSAIQTVLAAVGREVSSCKEQRGLQVRGTAKAEPQVIVGGCVLPVRFPHTDRPGIKALMYKHSNTARWFQGTSAALLQHTVTWNAGHSTALSEMGFHKDDDVGVSMGVQEGGDFVEKAAATVPE